jgi:hypothetical protein
MRAASRGGAAVVCADIDNATAAETAKRITDSGRSASAADRCDQQDQRSARS